MKDLGVRSQRNRHRLSEWRREVWERKLEQEDEYLPNKGESAHSSYRVKDLTHFGMKFRILPIFSS